MAEAQVRALMALARATVRKQAPAQVDTVEQRNHVTEEAAVIAALAAWFATAFAITAVKLPAHLIAELVELGVPARAAGTAGELGLSVRLTGRTRHGSPAPHAGMTLTRQVAADEPTMRARFVLAAARRLALGLTDDEFTAAEKRERHYLELHVAAGRKRRAAAAAVDEVAASSATGFMRWNTQQDTRVTPDCRLLEGRLFTADNLPAGAIPGAVHMSCRCFATAWGGAPLRV